MQPITKLGTINALRGLKRPQKTVVRLITLVYTNIPILPIGIYTFARESGRPLRGLQTKMSKCVGQCPGELHNVKVNPYACDR